MGFWNDVGEGLTYLGQRTPLVQDFFENPEADAKDQAYRDALKRLQEAQGQSEARRQDTLKQSLAYFQPTQQLLGQMYGPDYAAFFKPHGGR